MFSTIFTDIGTGLSSLVTSFFGALLSAFQTLFMNATVADGVTTYSGISPVGEIALVFIVIAMVYKMLPTVLGWFRLRARKGGKKRVKARA